MKNSFTYNRDRVTLLSRLNPERKGSFKTVALEAITCLLVILWIYTAMDKLLGYEAYRRSMYLQPFHEKILLIAVPALPYIELLTAGLLISDRYRIFGFWLTALLMLGFSIYVGLVYYGFYPEQPCSCAGLFQRMSWLQHLLLNCGLLLLTLFGLLLYHLKRKEVSGTS